jgi:hypothetical protein
VLIAFLFNFSDYLLEVDVGRLIILQEVLLGMLDDAVGTQRHQALTIATKIGEKFIGVVSAVYLSDLAILGQRCLVDSGHHR